MFGKAPRGATQRAPAKEKNQPLVPTWLWMVFGILLGLSFAALLYLWQPWQPAQRPIDATQPITTNAVEDDEETNQEYQFYELLPKQQVTPVPDEAIPETTSKPSGDHIIIAPPTVTAEQNSAHADPVEMSAAPAVPQYILQVNSYKNPDAADARRAEILLVGLPADVRQNTLADGTVWFRVISGPFNNKTEALNAQRLLQDSSIDSLVVEQH